MTNIIIILTAYVLDLFLGDPQWLYHPVQAMGALISFLEKIFRRIIGDKKKHPVLEVLFGGFLALLVISVSVGVTALFLMALRKINEYLYFVGSCIIAYQYLACKSLYVESRKVFLALTDESVSGEQQLLAGRKAVSMIVGRDTDKLSGEQVAKAAVETIAENFSDGVVAPLFYLALFGPLGIVFYKGINTMDSMLGYHNERYEYFGKAAARLDDLAGFIPSRIGALTMILATVFMGKKYSTRMAFKIFLRDRYNHKSPNSAQCEAVMAGALGVRLAGDSYYFGKLVSKPTIGDENRKVEAMDIMNANYLMVVASSLFVVIGCLLSIIGYWVL